MRQPIALRKSPRRLGKLVLAKGDRRRARGDRSARKCDGCQASEQVVTKSLPPRPDGEVVLEAAHGLTAVVKYDNIELEVLDDKSNKADFMD